MERKTRSAIMAAIIVLSLLACRTGRAEDFLDTHLGKGLFTASLAPAAFWTQIMVHESTHALAAGIMDRPIYVYSPYPHVNRGNFVFGRTESDVDSLSPCGRTFFYLAPALTDVLFFTISELLLALDVVDIDSKAGRVLYVFGMAAPASDFVFNYAVGTDWREIRRDQGAWIDVAGAVFGLAMVIRLLMHGKGVLGWEREDPPGPAST